MKDESAKTQTMTTLCVSECARAPRCESHVFKLVEFPMLQSTFHLCLTTLHTGDECL